MKINIAALIAGLMSLSLSIAIGVNYVFDNPFFQSPKNIVGFWSFVIAAVALVVTGYFAILGLMAKNEARGIETQFGLLRKSQNALKKTVADKTRAVSAQIETQLAFLTTSQNSLVEGQSALAESLWESYTWQLDGLSYSGKKKQLADKIRYSRGKLGYLFPALRETRRSICLFDDLGKVGTAEDITPLQKIVDSTDPKDTSKIKESAQLAINMIQVRPS